jgi:hypothetical protein
VGLRRPFSQLISATLGTFSTRANTPWLTASCSRIAAISPALKGLMRQESCQKKACKNRELAHNRLQSYETNPEHILAFNFVFRVVGVTDGTSPVELLNQ